MQEFLKRQEIGYLEEWATQYPHKPLVIRGARQVGKSTLVREFARAAGMPLVEVNFERNPELREAFAVNDPIRILSTLNLLTGRTVSAGTSLLFLDEIQAAPEALAALRYFCEEMPELHVVAAGSLMEFVLAGGQFPMPVGRVEYLHLGPRCNSRTFWKPWGMRNWQRISAACRCRMWRTAASPAPCIENISNCSASIG